MYATTDEVYGATSLTTSEITAANVTEFIKAAEREVDLVTFTTYWNNEDSGTAESGTSSTLTDTDKSWTTDEYDGMYVWITGGTGVGQIREIASNTATALTVTSDWDTNPSSDSTYNIYYTSTSPYYSSPALDGEGNDILFLPEYPLRQLESLSINGTSITVSNVYKWENLGKLQLSSDAEKQSFDNSKPQLIDAVFWWGVMGVPYEVKRYVIVTAALRTLSAQMGGTHNIPSTYSLPEGSVTIGQAYVNIRGTFDVLMKEKEQLKKILIKYPRFG